MSFKIDRQSVGELNLMGKFRQGSVYYLFNKVRTRIGEKLMDDMFSHPLTDSSSINRRVSVFRFFQQQHMPFPFEAGQVALMREYIETAGRKSQLSTTANIYMVKILAGFIEDSRYKNKLLRLQATMVTLKKCIGFLQLLQSENGPLQDRVEALLAVMTHKDIRKILESDIYKSMSVATVAEYDFLLSNKHNQSMKEVLQFIAETDVYITVSDVAREHSFCYAEALEKDENVFYAKNLHHPCMSKAIGNDIHMKEGSNVLFLTGANMAGKSTWMKSIGICIYMAHIGFPVAADEMRFSIREGIFSSINVADNITMGYSHFYAEVIRVKHAALAAATGEHLLLMFDELFKGTNVKDAYDGTLAVTQGFSGYNNCLFIVSTHIIEIGEALKDLPNVQFHFMPTVLEGNIPRYTYTLQKGITEDRQGMMIIKNEGIIELINNI
ncbi:MutS-related protein [Pseudobacter ginsenosidimutans]|uniref:MutS-like protein n=1 Tax=Pseudobacter ginsenosidimutans TaxID=661488 RepID=A0A4Q7MVA8_9BACT|nr:DNA mismatch repair protein [Pseudobacter ginsenosidimutans]QEC42139.1 DNA mismatch repair protein [Pseudobacter ginsenosidimutans]RZS71020.1 MutS-like protein [Pseudobacter ginsenosidimutans]